MDKCQAIVCERAYPPENHGFFDDLGVQLVLPSDSFIIGDTAALFI
ncbi:hypothetical protein [Rhizobium sp. BR 362]